MTTIFTKNLKCKLGREEVEKRAARMADVESDLRQVEEHRKSVVADLNGRKKALDSELATLGRQVREHAEYRDVECVLRPDYSAGTMETVRLDTEEQVDVRKLFDSEKQAELPLDGSKQTTADLARECVEVFGSPAAALGAVGAVRDAVVGGKRVPVTVPVPDDPGLAQIEAQEAARTGVAGPLTLPEAAEALADAPPLADPEPT